MQVNHLRVDDLMSNVLAGMAQDMPWLLGADITAYRDDRPIVFATCGAGSALQDVQVLCQTGPTREAAITDGPVTSDNLWNDRRWPRLNLAQACTEHPQHARVLRKVCGTAALPGLQDDSGLIVITVYLAEASTDGALDVMTRYERLVTADVAALSAFSGPDQRTNRVLAALQRRDVVEQAKGVVMATCGIDQTMAWMLLQDACRRSNTNVRTLAAELTRQVYSEMDRVGDSVPSQAAGELWSALKRVHASTGN
ncbi:hypothetical protein JOF56_004976 [Kibdelosporangium banguiense]|uniref:ANTAR domain-containing protein n=1 Tax=Kibdelosporangium banguiense TaxID=1365924 RepID=A0ABS4TJQ5_9PSEU|nr:ANTAR domain-containing protein [Kibdelosporangium banguiense]MBP2324591.1 hypothetical protein [Kibdelosporangium banguiense]